MVPQRALNMIDNELQWRSEFKQIDLNWNDPLYLLTFFGREHFDHMAKLAFPHAVVDADFHFKLGQRCNAVVFVNISRCIR